MVEPNNIDPRTLLQPFSPFAVGPGFPQELLSHYRFGNGQTFFMDDNVLQQYNNAKQTNLNDSAQFVNDLSQLCQGDNSFTEAYDFVHSDGVNFRGGLGGYHIKIVVTVNCCSESEWEATGIGWLEDLWDFDIDFQGLNPFNDVQRKRNNSGEARTIAGAVLLQGTAFEVRSHVKSVKQRSKPDDGIVDQYIQWTY